MPLDKFLIGFTDGNASWQNNLRPWLIANNAFQFIENCYPFRGRIRKRFGAFLMNQTVDASVAQLYSRLRVQVGTTDAGGNVAGVVPGAIFKVGQMFSIGNEMFTVVVLGAPGVMLTTGASIVHTYNTTNGAFNITNAAPLTPVYFYPAEPVMGLLTYEIGALLTDPTIGFDTQFAYQFIAGAWTRIGAAVWTGSNSQFFWGTTWRGVADDIELLFVVNNNAPDRIKYWNGAVWTTMNPVFNAAGDTIETALMVTGYKDRLILLKPQLRIAGVTSVYQNQIRFSQNGDPTAADAWREDIPGKGGFLDAPTQEPIVSCEFIKDTLIVYFENSTWQLVYTGNSLLPFMWQKINTELGCESTFSVVPFDRSVLCMGNFGVIECTGVNVTRIDDKIPDEVFNIRRQNSGINRVYGIRDFFVEMAYFTFPSISSDAIYPNRVLVYNYKTGGWGINDDTITCFGYYQDQFNAPQVLDLQYRRILAGNQEGFVFIIDTDTFRNAPALQITNITYTPTTATLTIIEHNLTSSDYIAIEQVQGITGLNNRIFLATFVNSNTITIDITGLGVAGVYTGGGVATRVSRINLFTKQYNFYTESDRNIYVPQIDFLVSQTINGQVTVDYYTSSSVFSLTTAGVPGVPLGTGVLETSAYPTVTYEQSLEYFWHRIYSQAEGSVIQLQIFLSDTQMVVPNIAWSDFQLHAMLFYAQNTSYRLQAV